MGAEINSADINHEMDERQDDKLQFHESKTTDLVSPIRADRVIAGTVCSLRLHCTCLSLNSVSYIFPVSYLQGV